MRVTVVGQKGNGPVLMRTVSLVEFIEAWGPWATVLWQNAHGQTLEIEGHKVRIVLDR
jgi:hypothetical protein